MTRMRHRKPRLVATLIVLVAAAGGAFAGRVATAASVVPAAKLGQGSAATSPYTVSTIAYTLDVNSPQYIDQVAFTISPSTARVVRAQLSAGGAWYACTNTAGSVTCPTTSPQATATTATNLTVVATQ